MVSSSSILTHITSTCSRTVKLPNGVDVEITHIDRVQLTLDIVLNNVLCVPSFQFNLISVGKLIHDANCLVTLLSNSCLIQDQSSKKMIGAGKLHGDLFLFQSPSVIHLKCLQVLSSSNLWHQRLGHPSHKRLKLISNYVSDLKFSVQNEVCEVCPLAKQTRLPFPLSNKNSFQPLFETIHCGIWGKYLWLLYLVLVTFSPLLMTMQDVLGFLLCDVRVRHACFYNLFTLTLRLNLIRKSKFFDLIMGGNLK